MAFEPSKRSRPNSWKAAEKLLDPGVQIREVGFGRAQGRLTRVSVGGARQGHGREVRAEPASGRTTTTSNAAPAARAAERAVAQEVCAVGADEECAPQEDRDKQLAPQEERGKPDAPKKKAKPDAPQEERGKPPPRTQPDALQEEHGEQGAPEERGKKGLSQRATRSKFVRTRSLRRPAWGAPACQVPVPV